jgi:hypothetical protein
MTRLRITNTYLDRSNSTLVTVTDPEDLSDLEDWWEDVVFPHTGDGLGGDACYTARVTQSPIAALIGQEFEWIG